MLGDKAYDSAELREELDERGTKPVIPNRCNRKQPFSFSKRLYRLRWRIENAFNRLKDFRRAATRYDRLALNYLASVCLAAALVWVDLMSRDSLAPTSWRREINGLTSSDQHPLATHAAPASAPSSTNAPSERSMISRDSPLTMKTMREL